MHTTKRNRFLNCGIYTITSPSGRFYVGSGADLVRRWVKHLSDLRRGVHGNCNLQRAAKKYGVDSLTFKVILFCSRDCLLMYEQLAIDALRPEYNIARTAGNGLGIKRTPEFRAKISAALRGRVVSVETRAKIGAKHRGKVLTAEHLRKWRAALKLPPLEERQRLAKFMHTPEARAKRRAALFGHPVSAATRAKISASNTGKKRTLQQIENIKLGQIRATAARTTSQLPLDL